MASQDFSAKGAAKSLINLSTERIGVAAEVDNNIVLLSVIMKRLNIYLRKVKN